MKCIECGRDAVVVRKPKMLYEGINVENVFLRNVEVELCRPCGNESIVVRNIKKVHSVIALGIALQPARLSGAEVRFLRKAMRMNIIEWASRIGIAPETFSRWENGRSPAQQVEKLARIDFLMAFSKDLSVNFVLQDSLEEVLSADLIETRDFALLVDAEDLDAYPEYRSLESPEFVKPNSAYVRALTFNTGRLAEVRLYHGDKIISAKGEVADGENNDACIAFEAAA